MDHKEALQTQACEKYLLGELTPELRDAYEEHYFSCPECASDLRAAAELIAAGRRIFAEKSEPVVARQAARIRPDWFAWLKPALLVPAFAALLLVVAYQEFVTIPRYKQAAGDRVLPMHSLIAANTRGDQGLSFSVPADQPFGLYVDLPYDPSFSVYLLKLSSPSGSVSSLRSLTAVEAQKTQVITINPGHQAGPYTIIVSGLPQPGADPSSAKELARLQFTVELSN